MMSAGEILFCVLLAGLTVAIPFFFYHAAKRVDAMWTEFKNKHECRLVELNMDSGASSWKCGDITVYKGSKNGVKVSDEL